MINCPMCFKMMLGSDKHLVCINCETEVYVGGSAVKILVCPKCNRAFGCVELNNSYLTTFCKNCNKFKDCEKRVFYGLYNYATEKPCLSCMEKTREEVRNLLQAHGAEGT